MPKQLVFACNTRRSKDNLKRTRSWNMLTNKTNLIVFARLHGIDKCCLDADLVKLHVISDISVRIRVC